MNITIKNPEQIKNMQIGGKILSQALALLKSLVVPGVNCLDLDKEFENFIKKNNCTSNFNGYYGYPKNICISINEQLIHGIPKNRIINEGDIVSIDAGLIYNQMHLDAAITTIAGKSINQEFDRLINCTEESLYLAINKIKSGIRIGELSSTIQTFIESKGFYLPTEFCGHGIGYAMHEDPQIPNVGNVMHGMRLFENMTICIEPMVQIGTKKIKILDDKWTVISADKSMTAHFEHTILVTKDGFEILTQI